MYMQGPDRTGPGNQQTNRLAPFCQTKNAFCISAFGILELWEYVRNQLTLKSGGNQRTATAAAAAGKIKGVYRMNGSAPYLLIRSCLHKSKLTMTAISFFQIAIFYFRLPCFF